jgi:signal transduction histidine kinase
MESTVTQDPIAKLIPVLSEQDRMEILAYFSALDKYSEEVSERFRLDLMDHPIFGRLIKDIPKEVSDAQNKFNRALQKDAIENNNWRPYIEYQIQQGIMYAKMGLDFKSWFEIVGLARTYLTPYLQKEYGNSHQLLVALNGLNIFMDIGMGILSEAYMQEKNAEIQLLNDQLEQKVIDRTAQLEAVNKELEAFTYTVSHDLRAPLRAVNGYAEMLNEDYGHSLDDEGKRIIATISESAAKMGTLIDELLAFSQLGRKELKKTAVDMKALTDSVVEELTHLMNSNAHVHVKQLPLVKADYGLIHQVMINLVSNALKYSAKSENPRVEIASEAQPGEVVISIRDNGAGFDMRYADKLFGVFQRLHSQDEFEGSGVGLAIVHRIVARHGGRVWAEGQVGRGATFHFSLPNH